MKKLLFAIPILALAALFTYCDRPSLEQEAVLVEQTATERGGGDRYTECRIVLDIASASILNICGTNSNQISCSTCGPTPATGFISTSGVSPLSIPVMAPTTLYFTSATGNTVVITTATNTYGPFNIPAGNCVPVNIAADCTAY